MTITEILNSKVAKEKAVYNRGNTYRLREVMKKARDGEKVVIAAIGGSITEGSGAPSRDKCWASRFFDYFCGLFPNNTDIQRVNAGIGATGSAQGIYRLNADVLDKKPDLVIVEFAVNDTLWFKGIDNNETYESVVRACLKSGAAVIELCVPNGASGSELRDGEQNAQKMIGKHYDLPVISVTDALRDSFAVGDIVWKEYSNDGVHPHEMGHKVVAAVVNDYIGSVFADLDTAETDKPIPEALTSEIFFDGQWFDNEAIAPVSLGSFKKDDPGFYYFKRNWLSDGNGDPIVFELTDARTATIMYLRTKIGNGFAPGRVVCEVEGETTEYELETELDTWGAHTALVLLHRSTDGKGRDVKITIYPGNGKFDLLRIGKS